MFEQRHITTVTFLNLHKLIPCVLPYIRVIAGRDDTIPRLYKVWSCRPAHIDAVQIPNDDKRKRRSSSLNKKTTLVSVLQPIYVCLQYMF